MLGMNVCVCVCMFMLAPPYILYQETILSGNITDTLTAGEGNENLLVAERDWNVKVCSSNAFNIKISRSYNL